jgi:hypothetical protein
MNKNIVKLRIKYCRHSNKYMHALIIHVNFKVDLRTYKERIMYINIFTKAHFYK